MTIRTILLRRAWIVAAAALPAACALPGPGPAPHYYVLQARPAAVSASSGVSAPPPAAPSAGAAALPVLLLAPTSAASFFSGQDIVFSREPDTRGYYQYSRWTEPAQRRIDAALMSRLGGAGWYRAVASATSGVAGSLLLRTRLDDMVHEAATSPGICRIVLTAELTDTVHHTLVARKTFTATAAAASYDAAGAVRGFDAALGVLVSDVAAWLHGVSMVPNTAPAGVAPATVPATAPDGAASAVPSKHAAHHPA
jgi:cholesterol transport system auxiliary component